MFLRRLAVCASLTAAALCAASQVTEVRLRMIPGAYSGPCPGQVRLVGQIVTDGPGTVWYQFLAGAVSNSPEGRIAFSEAGMKTVSIEGNFHQAPSVPEAALIAIMQDEAGNHGPQNVSSGPVPYNITCGAPAGIALPEGTVAEAEYLDGPKIPLKPQEQVALVFLQDMKTMEDDGCMRPLTRFCPLEELIRGVQEKDGQLLSFKRNPLDDLSYRYAVTIQEDGLQIEAVPRRAGLGGFLMKGRRWGAATVYYNPAGAAAGGKELGSYGFSGDDFIAR
jgi:hypothetical protein